MTSDRSSRIDEYLRDVKATKSAAKILIVDDPRLKFGKAVRRYRLRLKVSQEELAARAGLDRSYMGQVERGETNISLLNMVKIADALEVGPEQLVRGIRNQGRPKP